MKRLPPQPEERINRTRPLSFTFDGSAIDGLAGDTIASALLASGRMVLSRSFKYHRPRGEFCGRGQCSGSLVQIDGAPGVRACAEPAREGIRVEHQNAWPSLSFDVMRAVDLFGGPFTPVGFYYKTFIRPRRLWPLYERILRGAAGLGTLPHRQNERQWRTQYRRRHCDVLVVGGGVAGLSAALRAAELGADVVLCDDDCEPGGGLLTEGARGHARELARQARAAGVELLERASALGHFDGLVAVWQGDTLHQVRAPQHVVATGTIEQPLVFAGNDLPGVMLAGGARRLAALYALGANDAAVVVGVDDRALESALALHAAGVRVAAVADLRVDAPERPAAAQLAQAGVRVLPQATVVRASGRRALQRVVLAQLDADGAAVAGSEQEIDCDVLAMSAGAQPAGSLLLQAGGRLAPAHGGGFRVEDSVGSVRAAGALAGYDAAEQAEHSGRLAGTDAALALGFGSESDRRQAHEERAALEAAVAAAADPSTTAVAAPAFATARSGGGKAFVDFDEDVTVKDIKHAADEGFDSAELSKRYTTATMGPTQGRYSGLAASRVLAAHTGTALAEVGLTTARPPWTPVPMGILAGRPFEPTKRSALHGRHRELGASVKWAGDWRRAYDYGDPAGETLAVQRACGLIDVSTLGKLLVRGPDAGELLDRLYPNRMSNLKVGRVRYGVLCSDAGRITDDGTVCRLDEETFYVTTTSSGAGAVEQWFSWWLADWKLDAHLTDLTQGLVAVNLAGPRAREVLSVLTDLDCSPEAFTYLDGKQARVADVLCLLLRIGFVGELGYEIHCPAAHGRHLWDSILAAGAEADIRPFGLEPQRILRLQKMHVLVGQDTDAESTPYGASMGWVVKLDKEQEFIGRFAFQSANGRQPTTLVGFTTPGGELPTEGAVVLDGEGRATTGQVTSARRSPLLDQVIGMAWVPNELACDDARFQISDAGRTFEAVTTTKPFYDPDGELLRS